MSLLLISYINLVFLKKMRFKSILSILVLNIFSSLFFSDISLQIAASAYFLKLQVKLSIYVLISVPLCLSSLPLQLPYIRMNSSITFYTSKGWFSRYAFNCSKDFVKEIVLNH